jgi:hypothetical protein
MSSDRLREVEEYLKILRDQRRAEEQEILTTRGNARTQAEQRLRLQINPKLRQYEAEKYWLILANVPEETAIAVANPAPEVVVAEIVEHTRQLQTNQQYPDEVLEWLQRIYAEVSEKKTAEAKLKGVLSLLPPFVSLSYEAELDTENFLQAHFPTFRRWSKALAKKS